MLKMPLFILLLLFNILTTTTTNAGIMEDYILPLVEKCRDMANDNFPTSHLSNKILLSTISEQSLLINDLINLDNNRELLSDFTDNFNNVREEKAMNGDSKSSCMDDFGYIIGLLFRQKFDELGEIVCPSK